MKKAIKFTIIMPTFNDAKTISDAVNSVIVQTYPHWELIIVDDGSTDDTQKQIKELLRKDSRITAIKQNNMDQLNAIINASDKISGDFVYILHSDDELVSTDVLEKANTFLLKHPKLDAAFPNTLLVDAAGESIGYQTVRRYKRSSYIPPLTLLWLGRNLYADTAFHSKESFLSNVMYNYLTWNRPFWLDLRSSPRMINAQNMDFPSFKYRISPDNYINDEMGALNVINGEIRTALNLMAYYSIPFFKLQYLMFRAANRLHLPYIPIYFNHETRNKYVILLFIIKKRLGSEYNKNIYIKNLLLFVRNSQSTSREICFSELTDELLYYGKDIKKFNSDLLHDKLPDVYRTIINEMPKGFKHVIVKRDKDVRIMQDVLKFLSIDHIADVRRSD